MLDRARVPALVLGGGSNVVIADEMMADLTVVLLANSTLTVDGGLLLGGPVPTGPPSSPGPVGKKSQWAGMSFGHSGFDRRDARPERRRLRRRSGRLADQVRLLNRTTGECGGSPPTIWVSATGSILKNSSPATVLEVEFGLAADGLSAPIHATLAAVASGVPAGRTTPDRVRAAVLALRAAKGWCSTDRSRHLERRFVLHQPGGGRGHFARLQGRGRQARPTLPGRE